jgi:hypothetical protein
VFLVLDPGKLVPEKVHDFLVKVFFSVAIAQWGAYTLFLDRRQPVPDFKLIKPPQQSFTIVTTHQQHLPKKIRQGTSRNQP